MVVKDQALAGEGNLRFPLWALLHPREQARAMAITLAIGTAAGIVAVRYLGYPLWIGTTIALAAVSWPVAQKWLDDLHRYGPVGLALSILLMTQGFHALEHAVQVFERYVLGWPPYLAHGLISALDVEWVHFSWNWVVVFLGVYLIRRGMRGPWAWLFLIWALAHSLEHTYLTARYLLIKRELAALGVPAVSAQGLPGLLGRDGWLAKLAVQLGFPLGRLPGLTTAPRIDLHFWYNVGEMLFLILAAHVFLRERISEGRQFSS